MPTRNLAPPLFRPEVITAQHEHAVGAVLLVPPVSTRVLTMIAVAVAAALAILSYGGAYTRKAHVTGYLMPAHGLIKVQSRETGTIVERNVTEGQRVSKGDVLFVISMERSSRDATESQGAAIAKLRERRISLATELAQQDHLAQIEALELRNRFNAMEIELAKLAEEIVTQEMAVASAETILRMYQQLFTRSLGSAEQSEAKRKDFLEEKSRLQALQRSQIAITREREALGALVAAAAVRAATQRAAVQRGISALDQELTEYESRRTFVVTAPLDGTATAVLANAGQTAVPAQPLVSLLPAQAFPYQRFGSYQGGVTEISRTLILQAETAVPLPLAEPAYRVIVTIDSQSVKAYGHDVPLQPGMLLDANIQLDRRRLYQWLLDPLYSIRGRI
ncbi:MAG: hypothetical protein DMF95_24230 [Acidobacteria bacterium]|nr:MAG: hypothetical protein DMF95_24230 [Acidobacteriota bacterium]